MRALTALLTALLLFGCASIPEPSRGGDNLPNAGAGPFRALTTDELGNLRAGPNALEDDAIFPRDPAVLDLDGDPATFRVAAYVGAAVKQGESKPQAGDPTRAILRYEAVDGRSFDRSAERVLEPEEAWEGGVMGGPAALLVSGETFLYYAAAGGIGLARSGDGHAFTREPGPVLGPVAQGWEAGAVPTSPGVVRLPDGSFRMFYEVPLAAATGSAASAIGEASSPDGMTWTRVGEAPSLAPAEGAPGGEPPVDGAAVGSPFPILAVTAEGRQTLRLYYGARDGEGHEVIGMAARLLDAPGTALQRAAQPVFGTSKPLSLREPCVLAYEGFALLFATAPFSATKARPAVAVGVAPATAALPAPEPR